MIVDLYEAVDRMLWAIAAWIVAGAAVVTLLGYVLAALVWCAWTTVRRGVAAAAAWRGLRRAQELASRPQGPGCGSRDAGDAPEPPEARTDRRPSWAQTDRKAA